MGSTPVLVANAWKFGECYKSSINERSHKVDTKAVNWCPPNMGCWKLNINAAIGRIGWFKAL